MRSAELYLFTRLDSRLRLLTTPYRRRPQVAVVRSATSTPIRRTQTSGAPSAAPADTNQRLLQAGEQLQLALNSLSTARLGGVAREPGRPAA
jgi:hypothetical protein